MVKPLYFSASDYRTHVQSLLGEYHCKIDPKGRLMFPSKVRKQLEEVMHHGLVVSRDIFSKCLVLYPKDGWDKVIDEMSRLSRYNEEHELFMQKFMKGATQFDLDETGRLLLPSTLLTYAEIDLKKSNEVVLTGMFDKLKLWSLDNYTKYVLNDDDGIDIRDLAKKVGKDIEGGARFSMN